MIATAAAQTWTARETFRGIERRRSRARQRVQVIDEMLDVLELMHLNRDRVIDRMVRARLRRLEVEVGLPLPRKVVRARNTVRLHNALLDWQDDVLDVVVPGRRTLLELDELEEVREQTIADQRPHQPAA